VLRSFGLCGSTLLAAGCATSAIGAGQGAGHGEVPSCLEVHSAALVGPDWQELRLDNTNYSVKGRARWRVGDRVTTRGQWPPAGPSWQR
jgi:hypothetical protein